MDGEVTNEVVEKTRSLLQNKKEIERITEKNFEIAKKHFSYQATQKKLEALGFNMTLTQTTNQIRRHYNSNPT